MANETYLYLLQIVDTDRFKIGVSNRPWQRLKQIAPGIRVVRVWPALAYYEKTLHKRWSHKRITSGLEQLPVSGRTEWFQLTSEDVETIKTDCYCEQLKAQERGRIRQRVKCHE